MLNIQFFFLKNFIFFIFSSKRNFFFFKKYFFWIKTPYPFSVDVSNYSLSLYLFFNNKFQFNRIFSNKLFKKVKISFANKSFKIKKKKDFTIFFLNKAFLLFFFNSTVYFKLKKKNLIFFFLYGIKTNNFKKKLNYNIFTKKGFFLENNLFMWKKGKN